MTVRDTLERLLWTVLSAFLGSLAVANAFGLDAFQAAGIAAATAGINFVLIIARWRLSVLPNPGFGGS